MDIGEANITPPMQSQIAPDVVSPSGRQDLSNKLANATGQKQFLDFILSAIAKKADSVFTSRIKNPQTIVQKIAQKRIEGRNYNLDHVNDIYGGRFVIQEKSAIPQIQSMLKKAADLGIFSINKSEEVTKDTYHAHHLDVVTPDGLKGELQIMLPQEELESVANHSLRAVFGEKPNPSVAKLRDKQALIAKSLPNNKAHTIADAIQSLAKQNNDQPLSPQISAALLKQG